MCGQPPVSTPMMRSARQRLVAHQELRVLLGVDVVGHDRDVVAVAQRAAQRERERGLAGADRAADADAQGLRRRHCHDLNSRVYWVSWRAERWRGRARSCRCSSSPSRARSATTSGISAAERQQHALPGDLAERHRLQRREHLVLEPGQRYAGAPRAPAPPRRAPPARRPPGSVSGAHAVDAARAASSTSSSSASRRASARAHLQRLGAQAPRVSRMARNHAFQPANAPSRRRPPASQQAPAATGASHARQHVMRADRRSTPARVAASCTIARRDRPLEPLRVAVRADRQRGARELQQPHERRALSSVSSTSRALDQCRG